MRRFGRRAACAGLLLPGLARGSAAARLVVVGGGFGGATAARYARAAWPDLSVTLVAPAPRFVTCPYGNLLLAGLRGPETISFGYAALQAEGIALRHALVTAIDPPARRLQLGDGEALGYDRLILAPGIGIRWGALAGYDRAAAAIFPHAWLGEDGAQLLLLRRQLEAMPDGGVVGLSIPANPYRCPPGPYERISMIAAYLKRHKPRAKILALDAKDGFSKQALFQEGWRALYGAMIEWVPAKDDGAVARVDPAARVFETEFGTRHRVDVGNVIPPQAAAPIVIASGLAAAGGWAEVDPRSFAARAAPEIHIVGDAINGAPMPKSAFVAGNTAKQAAAAAIAALRGEAPPEGVYFNTCYSHVGEDYAISIVGIFRPGPAGFVEVPDAGGVSPRGAPAAQRRLEAAYADGWYASITRDAFG